MTGPAVPSRPSDSPAAIQICCEFPSAACDGCRGNVRGALSEHDVGSEDPRCSDDFALARSRGNPREGVVEAGRRLSHALIRARGGDPGRGSDGREIDHLPNCSGRSCTSRPSMSARARECHGVHIGARPSGRGETGRGRAGRGTRLDHSARSGLGAGHPEGGCGRPTSFTCVVRRESACLRWRFCRSFAGA